MAEGGADGKMDKITFEIDTFKFVNDMIMYMFRQRDIVWVPRERMVALIDYFGIDVARILFPIVRFYRVEYGRRLEQANKVLFETADYFNMFLCAFNSSLFEDGFRWIKFSSLLAFTIELAYFCVGSNQWRFVDILTRNLGAIIIATHEEDLSKNGGWAGYVEYCAVRPQNANVLAVAIQTAEELAALIVTESDRAFAAALSVVDGDIMVILTALRLADVELIAGTSSDDDDVTQVIRTSSAAEDVVQVTGASSEAAGGAQTIETSPETASGVQATGNSSETGGGAQVASGGSSESTSGAQVADTVALEKTGATQTYGVSSETAGAESVNNSSPDASNKMQTVVTENTDSLKTAEKSSMSSPVAIQALAKGKKSRSRNSKKKSKIRI